MDATHVALLLLLYKRDHVNIGWFMTPGLVSLSPCTVNDMSNKVIFQIFPLIGWWSAKKLAVNSLPLLLWCSPLLSRRYVKTLRDVGVLGGGRGEPRGSS